MPEVRKYHVVKCWKTDIKQLRKLPLEESVKYYMDHGDHYCVTIDVQSGIVSEKLIVGMEEMGETSRNCTYFMISPNPDPYQEVEA